MFAEAYEVASQFTRLVVVSVRRFDGSVECGHGAFVILNQEGWIATTAHIFGQQSEYETSVKEMAEYWKKLAEIDNDSSATDKQKRKRKGQLNPNKRWITNISWWWCENQVTLEDRRMLPGADLAIGRLRPFDASQVHRYPVLKNPQSLRAGTSLCKLGYPFFHIPATFDEGSGEFCLGFDDPTVPLFPLEGIYTRNKVILNSDYGGQPIQFLETSSPGLKGQSGGPIFDTKGTVWAIQSHTETLSLDFVPKTLQAGREVEIPQFLNIGFGVHPDVLTRFLRDNGVVFEESDY